MKALATLVVGERYQEAYEKFKESHVNYCDRHGWKHLVFTEPLDKEGDRKSIIAQKILVGTLEEYDTVVWIDSDIFITDTCPEIETCDPTKIGVCDQKPYHDDTLYEDVKKHRSWCSNDEYYHKYGFSGGLSDFNAGIMVFHPKFHSMYLRSLYDGLVKFVRSVPELDPETDVFMHYDQPYIGHHFLKDKVCEVLDWRHNVVWPVYRCILAEPYGHTNELLRPMKRLMDVAWSIHFTDQEDTDVLDAVKNILKFKDTEVIISRIEEFLNPVFRLYDFKSIRAPNTIYKDMRFSQTGFVIPKNVICIDKKDD